MQLSWIRMEVISMHAWSEEMFRCIREKFGRVMEVGKEASIQQRVEFASVLLLRDV